MRLILHTQIINLLRRPPKEILEKPVFFALWNTNFVYIVYIREIENVPTRNALTFSVPLTVK